MRPLLVTTLALGVSMIAEAEAQTTDPDPMLLVESERAFARDVAELGIRDGFLSHLAEGSVVFQAGPVDGRASYERRPKTEAKLAWEPVYAEITAGGDLGWTTGPWTFRPGEGEPVAAAGHYVSLWRLGKDGVRRVELDVGIFHEPLPKSAPAPDTQVLAGPGASSTVAELEEADRALSAAAANDVAAAYGERAAPDVRVYRMGSLPVVGPAGIDLATARGPFRWERLGTGISDGGDLGYTYGRARHPGAAPESDPGGYLRIWRLDGEGRWRLALDLTDLPEPEG